MTKTVKKHGGRRKGAGRKKSLKVLQMNKTIRVSMELYTKLERVERLSALTREFWENLTAKKEEPDVEK